MNDPTQLRNKTRRFAKLAREARAKFHEAERMTLSYVRQLNLLQDHHREVEEERDRLRILLLVMAQGDWEDISITHGRMAEICDMSLIDVRVFKKLEVGLARAKVREDWIARDKAWRQENGLPEMSDDYYYEDDDGH